MKESNEQRNSLIEVNNLPTLNENTRRVQALNIDGSFFPRRCAEEFRSRAIWQVVAEEYPVSYPRVGAIGQRLESAADIIVAAPSGWDGIRVFLTVECKKADPRYREWVFFRKHKYPDQLHRFRSVALHPEATRQRGRGKIIHEGNPANPLCDFGRELAIDHKGNSTSQRIQEAARQAVLAARSFVDELLQRTPETIPTETPKVPDWLNWLSQDCRLDVLPVVVTTAKLLVCEFDASNVDLRSAQIAPGSVGFEELPWVIYDYPMTGGLAFDPDDVQPHKVQANPLEIITKMHVLFLQSNSLPTLAAQGIDPLPNLLEWR